MTNRLRDKVAIVFGAGLSAEGMTNGAAAALVYAREGAKIIAVDISVDAAERVAVMIGDEGGQAVPIVADVTRRDQVEAAVKQGLGAYGRIDILHNNVALNKPGGPVEMDEEVWDQIITLNIKSLFLTCKAVIPVMKAQGGGSIINISSIAGAVWYGRPTIAYASSKAAVNQFTRAIACQHGVDNIRCNAVMPGLIDSPRSYNQLHTIWKGDIELMRRERSKSVPMRKLGSPWDVANASLFFASDESQYVSGVVMAVDGGLTCSAPHSVPVPPTDPAAAN